MHIRSKRIEAAIRLEKLKHTKAVETFNRDCQRAVEEIIGDQSRRGILQSGITGTRLMNAEKLRAENILNNSLNLRRASILAVPEMASSELFKEFADELEHTAKTLTKVVPERLGARMGGVVQTESGSLLPSELEGSLKAMVRREIDIMQQENELLSNASAPHAIQPTADPRRVFLVHGRNGLARDAMFAFLRSIDLDPIEWGEAVSFTGEGSPFIGRVLEKAFGEAKAVIVLLTGDDLVRLGPRFQQPHDPYYETVLTPQPRPNVLFEAGMAFGRHPERTILVGLGQARPFSDVAGRNEVRISNRSEDRQALAARLKTAGCAVKTENRSNWLSAGDFDAAIASPDGEAPEEVLEMAANPALLVGQPILQLELVDPETREKLGNPVEVHPLLFNLPDPRSLPTYGKASVDFLGTRLDMSADNNDYYEDVADYIKARGTLCGIGLSVSNSSTTFADAVVVTLELESSHLVAVIDETDLPASSYYRWNIRPNA